MTNSGESPARMVKLMVKLMVNNGEMMMNDGEMMVRWCNDG